MIYLHLSDGSIIDIDGTIKDTHDVRAEITNFPLEDGSFVNDHTILKPKIIKVNCGVMDGENPPDIYSEMTRLRDERVLMDIQTHLALHKNFLIESVSPTREVSVGDLIMFDLVFKEVHFAKSKQIKIPRSILKGDNAKDKLSSTTARGEIDHREIEFEGKKGLEVSTTADSKQSAVVDDYGVEFSHNSLLDKWFLGTKDKTGAREYSGIKVEPNKDLVGFMNKKQKLIVLNKGDNIARDDLQKSKVVYLPEDDK